MGKKEFTIEEKIKSVELHICDGMGYVEISDRYGVPITTLSRMTRVGKVLSNQFETYEELVAAKEFQDLISEILEKQFLFFHPST